MAEGADDPRNDLGLAAFQESLTDEPGLSLDDLTQAYAELIGRGDDPYVEAPDAERLRPDEHDQPGEDDLADQSEAELEAARGCEVTPLTILESMLFVGHPENEPLTSERVAGLMRGVRPREIDDLVVELNRSYDAEGCPYRITSAGPGYRLELRDEFHSLRANFHGRVKAARLSQAAVDVLAIVAYRQPVHREGVDRLRGRNSGAILSQLIRRGLLRIERSPAEPRNPFYHTTERFLEVFGLESLQDLPQSPD